MFVYKYRDVNETSFKKSLDSIQKNYFWSANIEGLNDPFETIIGTDKFLKQTSIIRRIFNRNKQNLEELHSAYENLISHNKKIGIFSLSKTFLDELLWAHYADSHKGFCIEYDLDILLEEFKTEKVFSFSVHYNQKPPQIGIEDVFKKNDELILKMFSHKSKRWEYESEHRIITNLSGKQTYNPNALKSIYFGLRTSDEHKSRIFSILKDRNINYFQIQQIDKSYKFEIIKLINPHFVRETYLKEFCFDNENKRILKFKILDKEFIWLTKKGKLTIEINKTICEDDLKLFSNYLKDHLFQTSENIFIFIYVENQINRELYWATSHFYEDKLTILFNHHILENQ